MSDALDHASWGDLFDEITSRAEEVAFEAESPEGDRNESIGSLLAMFKRADDLKKAIDRLLQGANPRGKVR